MVIAFISWWYGAGWRQQVASVKTRILKVLDMFSIDLLLKTLFMPFRQISAGQVDGSLDAKMRALVDKLVSRVIGAMIRSVTIIAGVLVLAGYVCVGLMVLLIWPILPLLPFILTFFAFTGWMPWTA